MSTSDGTPEGRTTAPRVARGRAAAVLAAVVAATVIGLPGVAAAGPDGGSPAGVGAVSAPVAPDGSVCRNDTLCLWPQRGAAGTIDRLTAFDLGGCRTQDRASRSGENNYFRSVRVWELPGCEGRSKLLKPGTASGNFGFPARAVQTTRA